MPAIDELLRLPELAEEDIVSPAPQRYRHDLWPVGLKQPTAHADGAVVVRPRTTEAVSSLLAWAAAGRRRVAVFGAGTNVVGALDGGAEVILSLERLTGVRDL